MRRISVPFYRGSPGCISTRRWATAWGRTRWCEKSSITMAGDDFRQAVANVRLLSVRRSAGRLSVRFPVGHERFGSDVRPTSTAGHGRIGDGREASAHGSSFIVRRPVKSPRVRAVLKKDDRCRRTVRGHGLRPASSVSEVAVPGGSGCASCLASVLPFFGVQRGGRSPDGGGSVVVFSAYRCPEPVGRGKAVPAGIRKIRIGGCVPEPCGRECPVPHRKSRYRSYRTILRSGMERRAERARHGRSPEGSENRNCFLRCTVPMQGFATEKKGRMTDSGGGVGASETGRRFVCNLPVQGFATGHESERSGFDRMSRWFENEAAFACCRFRAESRRNNRMHVCWRCRRVRRMRSGTVR